VCVHFIYAHICVAGSFGLGGVQTICVYVLTLFVCVCVQHCFVRVSVQHFACICVCVCLVCVRAPIHQTGLGTCMYVCMYVCIPFMCMSGLNAHIYANHACTLYVCVCACVYVCMCMYIHTYTHAQTPNRAIEAKEHIDVVERDNLLYYTSKDNCAIFDDL
jgi:hypothetical protein